jgi:flagellar capping protein FliD
MNDDPLRSIENKLDRIDTRLADVDDRLTAVREMMLDRFGAIEVHLRRITRYIAGKSGAE